MTLFWYGQLMRSLQPLLLLKLWWRGRREKAYRLRWRERLGYYPWVSCPTPPQAASQTAGTTPLLWVHAVSLGETHAARIWLQALREIYPSFHLLLTHSTATGWEAGRALLQAGDRQTWLPWDSPGAVQRFFQSFRPHVGVLMETEIWPLLLHQAAQRRLPMLLVNARMSEKSFRGFSRFSWLFAQAWPGFQKVLAQSPQDAQRLQKLGARSVVMIGNVKFDARPDAALQAQAQQLRQHLQGLPVLALTSSREGEEALFFQALAQPKIKAMLQQSPLALLLVPRHPQRFDTAAELAAQAGWHVQRRSQGPWDRGSIQHSPQTLWLGDTLGEMTLYYSLADAVLMGGSFAAHGGQNFIEALACGAAVWLGPHHWNFAQAAQWARRARMVHEAPDMAQALLQALQYLQADHAPMRSQARPQAMAWVAQHQGAALRTAHAVRESLAQGAQGA